MADNISLLSVFEWFQGRLPIFLMSTRSIRSTRLYGCPLQSNFRWANVAKKHPKKANTETNPPPLRLDDERPNTPMYPPLKPLQQAAQQPSVRTAKRSSSSLFFHKTPVSAYKEKVFKVRRMVRPVKEHVWRCDPVNLK